MCYTRRMSKIQVSMGWHDLEGHKNNQRIVNAEFDSVYEMNQFILHQGFQKKLRVLALVKNLEDDFDDGTNNEVA